MKHLASKGYAIGYRIGHRIGYAIGRGLLVLHRTIHGRYRRMTGEKW